MDFVDNVIDRSSGTIGSRAVFSNTTGMFTLGMFGGFVIRGGSRFSASRRRSA